MASKHKVEARGGLQINLRQVALPHPTHSRSTRGKQTLGVRSAKQLLTQSESPTSWLMFLEPAATENVTTGYFHNYRQLSKTYWD